MVSSAILLARMATLAMAQSAGRIAPLERMTAQPSAQTQPTDAPTQSRISLLMLSLLLLPQPPLLLEARLTCFRSLRIWAALLLTLPTEFARDQHLLNLKLWPENFYLKTTPFTLDKSYPLIYQIVLII